MMDHQLEPDDDIEYRCECGECVACINDWEFNLDDDEPTDEQIRIAEFNYECLVYNEPERRIWR